MEDMEVFRNEEMDELNAQVEEGLMIENELLKRWCCLDIFFYPICILCFPYIVCFAIIFLPYILVLCFPCICILTNCHLPKEAPFLLKFLSFVMKIGFPFVRNCPVRWLQTYYNCFSRILSKFKSNKTVEEFEYFDPLRRKRYKVDLFIYNPQEMNMIKESPKIDVVMLYFHGGGYLVGHPVFHDQFYEKLIIEAERKKLISLKIVSVNYRKSPRFKVDSILFEVIQVMKYIRKKYPVSRLVISGDSAGGNLALLLAHYLRNTKYKIIPKPWVHVVPLYPVILRNEDFFMCKNNNVRLPSREEFGTRGVLVTQNYMSRFYELVFYDDPFGGKYNNYDFFKNMRDLPSHYIITGGFDFLRSDGELYFSKLVKAEPKKKHTQVEFNFAFPDDEEGDDDASGSVDQILGVIHTEEEEEEENLLEEEENEEKKELLKNQENNYETIEIRSSHKITDEVKEVKEIGEFEYFKYMAFEKETHGFNVNYFSMRKESKDILARSVIKNLEKKFCM